MAALCPNQCGVFAAREMGWLWGEHQAQDLSALRLPGKSAPRTSPAIRDTEVTLVISLEKTSTWGGEHLPVCLVFMELCKVILEAGLDFSLRNGPLFSPSASVLNWFGELDMLGRRACSI